MPVGQSRIYFSQTPAILQHDKYTLFFSIVAKVPKIKYVRRVDWCSAEKSAEICLHSPLGWSQCRFRSFRFQNNYPPPIIVNYLAIYLLLFGLLLQILAANRIQTLRILNVRKDVKHIRFLVCLRLMLFQECSKFCDATTPRNCHSTEKSIKCQRNCQQKQCFCSPIFFCNE